MEVKTPLPGYRSRKTLSKQPSALEQLKGISYSQIMFKPLWKINKN